MDLLRDILASQAAGNANAQNGMDNFYHGAELATNLSKAREENNILSSREQSNAQIANGDLIGALRTAQSSGDQQYQNNLMNHINQNRQTLGSIAQNLTNIDPAHRQAALQAANGTLGGLDVDTSSLNGADNSTLNALANSVIAPEQQIKNNQTDRGIGIDQQNADTSRINSGTNQYNAQTSRINSGIEQQNANTQQSRLGMEAAHYQNADNSDAYKNSQRTFTDEDGNTYAYNDTSAPRAIAIPNSQGTTLADRNNNPGNLVFAGQPGAIRDSSGYASFQNPQDGVNANLNQINRDINVHGYNTIDSLVDHWASTSPENERRAYKIALMRGTNKGINDKLTSDDAASILPLMAKQEGYSGTINGTPNIQSAPNADDINQSNAIDPTTPLDNTASTSNSVSPTTTNRSLTKMITLPNGQQVPATLIKAGRNASKAPTEGQETKAQLASEAIPDEYNLEQMENNGYTPTGMDATLAKNLPNRLANSTNFGENYNLYNNNIGDLVDLYARSRSGAAVGKDEMQRFVNDISVIPGDSPKIVAQKIARRKNFVNGLVAAGTNSVKADGSNPTPSTLSNIPTKEDIDSIRKFDSSALAAFKKKYGQDQFNRTVISLYGN